MTTYIQRVCTLVNKAHLKISLAERGKFILTHFVRGLDNVSIWAQLSSDTKLSTTVAVDKASAIAVVLHPESGPRQSNRRRDSDLNGYASSNASVNLHEIFFAEAFADQFKEAGDNKSNVKDAIDACGNCRNQRLIRTRMPPGSCYSCNKLAIKRKISLTKKIRWGERWTTAKFRRTC